MDDPRHSFILGASDASHPTSQPTNISSDCPTGSGEQQSETMTAIPTVLQAARLEQYVSQFMVEYRPVGPTELLLVTELGRHATALERLTAGCGAIERQAAVQLPTFLIQERNEAQDIVLASAMSAEGVERCERYSLLRSRAVFRVLEKLEALQLVRRQRSRPQPVMPLLGFADDVACEAYLIDRLRRGCVHCLGCGARKGSFMMRRKLWECAGCGRQAGLRTQTVMARSIVPLRQWFDAVRWVLWHPTIGAAELGRCIGLSRTATVRSMSTKLRTALASAEVSSLLAGLDRHFAGDTRGYLTQASFSEPTDLPGIK